MRDAFWLFIIYKSWCPLIVTALLLYFLAICQLSCLIHVHCRLECGSNTQTLQDLIFSISQPAPFQRHHPGVGPKNLFPFISISSHDGNPCYLVSAAQRNWTGHLGYLCRTTKLHENLLWADINRNCNIFLSKQCKWKDLTITRPTWCMWHMFSFIYPPVGPVEYECLAYIGVLFACWVSTQPRRLYKIILSAFLCWSIILTRYCLFIARTTKRPFLWKCFRYYIIDTSAIISPQEKVLLVYNEYLSSYSRKRRCPI